VDTRSQIKTNFVAGALTSTYFSIRSVMPLVLSVLASAYGFSEGQLGDIGSAYSVGATFIAMTSVVWRRGLLLRLPVTLFLVLGLAALSCAFIAKDYHSMLATFFAAGVGLGGVYSLMIALLARSDNPTRSLGWQWGLGSAPGVLLLCAIPAFATPAGGVRTTFTLILASNLLMALAAIALPSRLKSQARPAAQAGSAGYSPSTGLRVWIALFGLCALYVGVTGGWAFLGRLAKQAGLAAQYSGTILAIGAAVSSVVAVVAGEIGDRGARRASMTAAGTAILIALALIGYWPTRLGFAVGAIAFIALASFVLTFGTAIVARLDTDGRAVALPAAALGLGAMLGPTLAGHVYEARGAEAMLLACGLSLLTGVIAYVSVYRNAR
jgi:predicted MFS family arabinose efflux permease